MAKIPFKRKKKGTIGSDVKKDIVKLTKKASQLNTGPSKSKRMAKSGSPIKHRAADGDSDIFGVTSLSPTDLLPGSTIVGVIRRVNRDNIEVDLPCHMHGVAVEAQCKESEIESSSQIVDRSSYELNARFMRGQLVSAAVLAVSHDVLQLSVKPSVYNAGFQLSTCVPGMWLPCVLKTFEEFGATVETFVKGVEQTLVKRPPVSSVISARRWRRLRQGSIFNVYVSEVNMESRKLLCEFPEDRDYAPIDAPLDKSLLRAGLLVEASIADVAFHNKSVKAAAGVFCRVHTAVISAVHSTTAFVEVSSEAGKSADANLSDVEEESIAAEKNKLDSQIIAGGRFGVIRRGMRVPVRIIAVIPQKGVILASPLTFLTRWQSPLSDAIGYSALREKSGNVLHDGRVVAVDSDFAARILFKKKQAGHVVFADVSVKRCSDKLNSKGIPLKVGDKIKAAKVITSSLFERSVSVATAPGLLAQAILVPRDAVVGSILVGTVSATTPSFIFIHLSPYVTGKLHRDHCGDLPGSEAAASRFTVGKKVKVRVLNVDDRDVHLTAKPGLLQDPAPLLNFNRDCVSGRNATGVVYNVDASAGEVIVRFFNGIHGVLPLEKLVAAGGEFERKLRRGALIAVKISYADHLSRRLFLTLPKVDTLEERTDDCENEKMETASEGAAVPFALKIASEVMRALLLIRENAETAVPLGQLYSEAVTILRDNGMNRVASLLENFSVGYRSAGSPMTVGVLTNRELRNFSSPGKMPLHTQILAADDKFVTVLFSIQRASTTNPVDGSDTDEDVEGPEATLPRNRSVAVSVGVVAVNHLHDDNREAEKIQKKLRKILEAVSDLPPSPEIIESQQAASIAANRLAQRYLKNAVLLSSYVSLECFVVPPSHELAELFRYLHLPVLSLKQSIKDAVRNHSFVRSISVLTDAAEFSNGNKKVPGRFPGYVIRHLSSGILVALGSPYVRGFVPYKYLKGDSLVADIPAAFPLGATVTAKIISLMERHEVERTSRRAPLILDLRERSSIEEARSSSPGEADFAESIEALEHLPNAASLPAQPSDLVLGKDYPAVVKAAGNWGVFVALSRTVTGRIALSELTGQRLDPTQVTAGFPPGRILLAVRVISIGEKRLRGGEEAIDLSLVRAGTVNIARSDINEGDILAVSVKAKVDSGLILEVEQCSNLEAYCYYKHIDDVITDKSSALGQYEIGERLAAKVLDNDPSNKRLAVTLQPGEMPTEANGEHGLCTLQDRLMKGRQVLICSSSKRKTCSETIDGDALERNVKKIKGSVFANKEASDGSAPEALDSAADELGSTADEVESVAAEIGSGAELDDSAADGTDSIADEVESVAAETGSSAELNESGADDIDTDAQRGDSGDEKIKKTRAKRREENRRQKELFLREKETAEARRNSVIAESPDDFERLLLSRKNSALLWTQYIGYYIRLKDVAMARKVAERAVKEISMDEAEETANMWKAYLNFESEFGKPSQVTSVLTRAAQLCNTSTIWLHYAGILVRKKNIAEFDDIIKKLLKKNGDDKNVWFQAVSLQYAISPGREDKVTTMVFTDSAKRLSPADHIALVADFARLEFARGAYRRGCFFFDKLLTEKPKRTDFWSQYVDAAIKALRATAASGVQGEADSITVSDIRSIFFRAVNVPGFKPRQVKYLITRWLAFENEFGTAADAENVQKLARDYVSSLTNE